MKERSEAGLAPTPTPTPTPVRPFRGNWAAQRLSVPSCVMGWAGEYLSVQAWTLQVRGSLSALSLRVALGSSRAEEAEISTQVLGRGGLGSPCLMPLTCVQTFISHPLKWTEREVLLKEGW